jgi:hypothetical protein
MEGLFVCCEIACANVIMDTNNNNNNNNNVDDRLHTMRNKFLGYFLHVFPLCSKTFKEFFEFYFNDRVVLDFYIFWVRLRCGLLRDAKKNDASFVCDNVPYTVSRHLQFRRLIEVIRVIRPSSMEMCKRIKRNWRCVSWSYLHEKARLKSATTTRNDDAFLNSTKTSFSSSSSSSSSSRNEQHSSLLQDASSSIPYFELPPSCFSNQNNHSNNNNNKKTNDFIPFWKTLRMTTVPSNETDNEHVHRWATKIS